MSDDKVIQLNAPFIIAKHPPCINEKGMHIEEYEVLSGVTPPDFAHFNGVATIGLQTPRGTMPHTFNFPINDVKGDTRIERLTDAFNKFEQSMKEAIPQELERLQSYMKQQKGANPPLIIPGAETIESINRANKK